MEAVGLEFGAKKAGRRGVGANTSKALLQACAALISERGIGPISVREIADRAEMNQAMVRYHFGDKDGLMKAALDVGFDGLFAAVPQDKGFEDTVFALVTWMQANPWVAILMMRAVYGGDDLREHFEARHAPRLASMYRGALERGRKDGQVREDLDSTFAVRALISLLVFPNLAGPSFGRVLSAGRGAEAARNTANQIMKLFEPNVSET
ncbi:MAG: TetR/AcrR family transcriptional regulator [Alphaproteobacteria bacterium]|nr:TetR/AcrR family transcriptional regulator [Alphaproteobacteria bacterium]